VRPATGRSWHQVTLARPPRADLRFLVRIICSLLLLVASGCSVWQRVASWSGRGNQQLETFPIAHWGWRVQWATSNESPPGGTFKVTAHSGDSGRQIAEIAADVRGVDHDTTYVTDLPRSYYLVVESSNVDWSIIVEEGVPK
jgi:hypothetical protein